MLLVFRKIYRQEILADSELKAWLGAMELVPWRIAESLVTQIAFGRVSMRFLTIDRLFTPFHNVSHEPRSPFTMNSAFSHPFTSSQPEDIRDVSEAWELLQERFSTRVRQY